MQYESAIECTHGARLKRLRAVLQVEWKELARRIDLSVSMCMQVLKGTKNLSELALFRLEAAEHEAGITPPPTAVRETPEPYGARQENDSISVAIARIEAKMEDLTAEFRALREALKRVIK
jgi:transcriptional regulator with XRE-family HTH domain